METVHLRLLLYHRHLLLVKGNLLKDGLDGSADRTFGLDDDGNLRMEVPGDSERTGGQAKKNREDPGPPVDPLLLVFHLI